MAVAWTGLPSVLLGAVVTTALYVLTLFIPAPNDKVVFLDIGQGDAILLQNQTQQVLIDGGPGQTVVQQLSEELPWFDRTIEVLVVTHPQRDHLEGLLHVLERYQVNFIVLPYAAHDSQLQQAWLTTIEEQEIPYRFAWAGQKMTVGDMTIDILGPLDIPAAAAATKSDVNNASVITRVDYKDLSFLLTGDAEKRVESLLVNHTPEEMLDVDILKAGHHGSNSSTHNSLISAATPHAAVITVGENSYGHPHPAVLERLHGLSFWRTDEHGSVRFSWQNDTWSITTAQ